MISKANPKGYSSVIIDEGHHVCASTYRRIMRSTKGKVIALTATPYRLDGEGMGSVGFTHIVYGDDIFTLTNDSFLCPCEVFVPESEENQSWTSKSTATAISKRSFRSGIVYSRRVTEAKAVEKELNKLGIAAKTLTAKTRPEARRGIIEEFREGRIKVICNHTILTEGTDLPSVDLIVLNRATKSRALWRQMIGRGLRTHPGKEFCTVLDLASNAVTHGSIYDMEVYDLMGRMIHAEPRFIERIETENQTTEYEYNNGEELKPWKPLPELKIMRRTLLTLNAQLLRRRLLTDTSDI
jgi:ATP-dependent helicase IRC3